VTYEFLYIGDSFFIRNDSSGDTTWRKERTFGERTESRALETLNFSEVSLAGMESLNGRSVYRLEGKPASIELINDSGGTVIESSMVVFITKDTFEVIRTETHAVWELPDGEVTQTPDGKMTGTETKRYELTTTSETTFLDEPIDIQPPESYIDMTSDRLPSTPTSNGPVPRATPPSVPIDRNRGSSS
jgi:hypothetical protein